MGVMKQVLEDNEGGTMTARAVKYWEPISILVQVRPFLKGRR
jgi:hypothetical protein